MVGNLKAVGVERAAAVIGAGDVAELDFMQGFISMQVDGKGHFKQFVAFLPIYASIELDHPAAPAQADFLLERRGIDFLGQAYNGEQGTRRNQLDLSLRFNGQRSLFVHAVDIPGVKPAGYVLV